MRDLASLAERALHASVDTAPLVQQYLEACDIRQTIDWVRWLTTVGRGYLLLAWSPKGLERSFRIHDVVAAEMTWPRLDLTGARWVTVDADGVPWARVVNDDGTAVEGSADGRTRREVLADPSQVANDIRSLTTNGSSLTSSADGSDDAYVALHPDSHDRTWADPFDQRSLWRDGFRSSDWSGYEGDRLIGVAARAVHHARFLAGERQAYPVLGLSLVSA
jgi:hypothetical protein